MYGKLVPIMISVSHSSMASTEGAVPSRPMPPVVYGLRSGSTPLPSSALTTGPPTVSASCATSSRAFSAPRPTRMATREPSIDDVGGLTQQRFGGNGRGRLLPVAAVSFDVGRAAHLLGDRPLLDVLGDADVRDAAAAIGGANGHVDDVDGVRRAHDALVELGHVDEELVEIDVLLIVHADQIVEGVAGDGEHRNLVALGIVESIEQMNAAGAGSRDSRRRGVRCTWRSRTAAKAAASSCRTWMKRSLSWCVRKASKNPSTPSPG